MKHSDGQIFRSLVVGRSADSSRWITTRNGPSDFIPDTSETLLHLASRMGLSELCEYLLACPGSLVALRTCNSQGSLPQDLARQNGYDKLADRLASWVVIGISLTLLGELPKELLPLFRSYRESTVLKSENHSLLDRVISEGRDFNLPPTVTTLASDDQSDAGRETLNSVNMNINRKFYHIVGCLCTVSSTAIVESSLNCFSRTSATATSLVAWVSRLFCLIFVFLAMT